MTDSDLTTALAQIHFDHRLETVCANGIVYCHCSKFHPFQGVWAHAAHFAAVLRERYDIVRKWEPSCDCPEGHCLCFPQKWYHCYLHLTGEELQLLAGGPTPHDVEKHAFEWLADNEPGGSASVVTALIVDSLDWGEFMMRGPTPSWRVVDGQERP